MACHPEYQQRVQAEIAEHIGCVEADDHQQQQQELEMSAADVNNLSFLDRCIRETMRIFPLVPVMERELEHDMVIGDKKLPRGATVAIPPFLIHHNERVRRRMGYSNRKDKKALTKAYRREEMQGSTLEVCDPNP